MKVEIEGLEECLKKLEDLEKKECRKLMRKAVGEASKAVLSIAKPLVPINESREGRGQGPLLKSLGRRVKSYRRTGTVVGIIGARNGFYDPRTGEPLTKVANCVEFGTVYAAPHPFLRPAADQSRELVAQIMHNVFATGLDAWTGDGNTDDQGGDDLDVTSDT